MTAARASRAGRSSPGARGARRVAAGGTAALLAVLALHWGGAEQAVAQQPQPTGTEIRSLTFEGNESFSSRALARAILSRETDCRALVLQPFCWLEADFAIDRGIFSDRTLRDDYHRLQLFYYQRGFREARVDTTIARRDEDRVDVHVRIREGQPIRIEALEILGLEEVAEATERELRDRVPLEAGDRLDLHRLDQARDSIERGLRDRGYAHADVLRNLFIPSETPYRAEVEFDVFTGPEARFGPIEVVGNEKVDEDVVRRMLPFQEGGRYSREAIHDGQRNVFGLEIFRHASIQEDLDHDPDSVVPVRVQVNEGNTYRVRTGAGWSTAECVNTEGRWSSRNFFGGARRLVFRARVSNLFTSTFEEDLCGQAGTGIYGRVNWTASADFTQPWFFSPRNSLAAGIFFERQSLQDVFVRRGLGLNLALTRRLGTGAPLTLSYRPQLGSLDAAEIFFCVNFLVCDPEDIDVLQDANWLSPLGLTFSRDRRDQPFAPTRGYNAVAAFEHASKWTGSDFAYERLIAEASIYHSLSGNVVTAARLRGGVLGVGEFGGIVAEQDGAEVGHPQKRFYAGGANSVRGFAQNQLGPRTLTVDVEDLVGRETETGSPVCTPEEVRARACDAGALPEDIFLSRPSGGNAVLEGNAELRFRIPERSVGGSVFVDFGQVWPRAGDASFGSLELTPGLGVRYDTPIGPVRMDVAYRFSDPEPLPVVTSQVRPFDPDRDRDEDRLRGPDGQPLPYVMSDELAVLEPRVPFGGGDGDTLRRVQLHFSIGEAF